MSGKGEVMAADNCAALTDADIFCAALCSAHASSSLFYLVRIFGALVKVTDGRGNRVLLRRFWGRYYLIEWWASHDVS